MNHEQFDKQEVLKQLQDLSSDLHSHFQHTLDLVRSSDLIPDLREDLLNNDLDYALKVLTQTYTFGEDLITLKDGLIFTHMDSLYEEDLNSLVLHWRDPNISLFYCHPHPLTDAVLKLDTYDTL